MNLFLCFLYSWFGPWILLLAAACAPIMAVPQTPVPPSPLPSSPGIASLAAHLVWDSRCTVDQPFYHLERHFWYRAPNLFRLEEYDAAGTLVSLTVSNGSDEWYYVRETNHATWSPPRSGDAALSLLERWNLAALRSNTLEDYQASTRTIYFKRITTYMILQTESNLAKQDMLDIARSMLPVPKK